MSIMDKLLEINDELVKVRAERDALNDQLSIVQEKLNGELVEARKLIYRLEKGLHQARCHIQNMVTRYEKGD